ncbi:hypothetical protein ACFSTE_08520 [Aquimarina hainanensis]|uniref:Uncharacterized protein n=1 Tax=Aquimarina hainanensis TaxID=1578017 RepID=A0ABW5N5G0_9FLAO|nr:hypothetical protein [Aquimarina sp. TRL1]QKX03963.1 hypothetical protein HN014_03265 [Aquimarina sp. TRL1]
MKFKKKHIIFLLPIVLLAVGFSGVIKLPRQEVSVVVLKEQDASKQQQYIAGEDIELFFKLSKRSIAHLYISNSYGSTILESEEASIVSFILPDFIVNKKGKVTYKLLDDSNAIYEGELRIEANIKSPINMEAYMGPTSILVGGSDMSSFVIIPSDIYDNPLPDGTPVTIKHQFERIEKDEVIYMKNMYGRKDLYSYNKAGRVLFSSKISTFYSKEFSIDMSPTHPTDFSISSDRKHFYADGNQVTEFNTSVIRDRYGNVVSDGTMVEFVTQNTSGAFLRTSGSTLNGVANAKMLHPDHQDTWKTHAFINGMAESNTVLLDYKPVLDDFDVEFQQNNRAINVGPLLSFMEQLIADGTLVKLHIYKDGIFKETVVKESFRGNVTFLLKENFYDSGMYRFEVEALGITKEFENKKL